MPGPRADGAMARPGAAPVPYIRNLTTHHARPGTRHRLRPRSPEFAPAQFVRWFREVAPYVHAFRGKTFVVAFGGELVQAGALNTLVQDLSLLSALGIRLVLVHGSRPQVNEQLRLKGYTQQFDRGLSPTDAAALECAKGSRRRDPPGHRGRVQPGPAQHAHVALAHPGHLGQLRHGPPHRRAGRRGLQAHRPGPQDRRGRAEVRHREGFVGGAAVAAGFLAHGRRLQPGDGRPGHQRGRGAARRNSSSCPARTAC